MQLIVFGANGPTGRLLTRQLLDADNTVVAVTRRPATFPITDPRLTLAEADVFHQQAVAGALPGADAVLSVLGVPFTRRPVDTFSTGTANIVAAMRRTEIRRLIVVSSTATHHYRNRRNSSLMLRAFEPVISRTIGKTVYDDLRRMESIVRESDLDWTIVRPSILFDVDHTTGYIAGDVPPVGGFTARIDLAHYLTTLIEDAASIGTTPIVSTTEGAPTFWEYMKRQSVRPADSKPTPGQMNQGKD
jgi:putative NADH-flavin reductase